MWNASGENVSTVATLLIIAKMATNTSTALTMATRTSHRLLRLLSKCDRRDQRADELAPDWRYALGHLRGPASLHSLAHELAALMGHTGVCALPKVQAPV